MDAGEHPFGPGHGQKSWKGKVWKGHRGYALPGVSNIIG